MTLLRLLDRNPQILGEPNSDGPVPSPTPLPYRVEGPRGQFLCEFVELLDACEFARESRDARRIVRTRDGALLARFQYVTSQLEDERAKSEAESEASE